MKITGNTILVTGGGSGIGRAFAEAFHKLGNQVIVAGRRQQVLDATASANPGMASAVLDIEDPAAIRSFAESIVKRVGFPVVGRVRTRMSRNITARPNAGPAEPISTSTSNVLLMIRVAASFARS